MRDTLIKKILVGLAIIIANLLVLCYTMPNRNEQIKLQYKVVADKTSKYQVFYSEDEEFGQYVVDATYEDTNKEQILTYHLPQTTQHIRLDLGEEIANIKISKIQLEYYYQKLDITDIITTSKIEEIHDIGAIQKDKEGYLISSLGKDPYITIHLNNIQESIIQRGNRLSSIISKIVCCIILNVIIALIYIKRKVVDELALEVYRNKQLIWKLSRNDFKTKYAGSYLGITWAFVQPIVTVLVYWFVFQVGFRSEDVGEIPFVLWLVTGIVPWFFFSDALMNATNSMLEYSYLVKKVVFKISILPIVKIISALFVHVFFVCFTLLLYFLYGYMPNVYMLQVIYYTICMCILVLGISYATCAIIIFFKDLGQIINIFLQIGMWLTPIMWSYHRIPTDKQWILKINPMYYIVEGYRDSLIYHVGFWHRFNQTIYFWIIAVGLFAIGTIIFKRLKVHFADVL